METVLAKIKPGIQEQADVEKKVQSFSDQLPVLPFIGGSYAKGTWLSGNHDIDLFVLYPPTAKHIATQLGKTLKKKFKNVVTIHGSRDYYQITHQGLTFEIIPVKAITRAADAENITDVSPLHVQWVNTHTNDFLKDQIRLAKQFCKAHHIYGAETYIKGFSGYVLEILVITYGNFAKLLRHALHWHEGHIIDVAGHYHGMNPDKRSALIVVDPVQPDRNAAAALSAASLHTFQDAAKQFLQRPTNDAFIEHHMTLKELKKYALAFTATPLPGKKDLVGTQLLKVHEYIQRKLREEGYTLTDAGWEWNATAYYWYTVQETELPKKKRHDGPPLTKQKNVQAFLQKHPNAIMGTEKGRVFVFLTRDYTTIKAYGKYLTQDEEIRKRVHKIRLFSSFTKKERFK